MADEFLEESNQKQSLGGTNSLLSQSNPDYKTSYLKSSNMNQASMQSSHLNSEEKQYTLGASNNPYSKKVFDYTASGRGAPTIGGAYLKDNTPMSELSYSYSEMLNDLEGS